MLGFLIGFSSLALPMLLTYKFALYFDVRFLLYPSFINPFKIDDYIYNIYEDYFNCCKSGKIHSSYFKKTEYFLELLKNNLKEIYGNDLRGLEISSVKVNYSLTLKEKGSHGLYKRLVKNSRMLNPQDKKSDFEDIIKEYFIEELFLEKDEENLELNNPTKKVLFKQTRS